MARRTMDIRTDYHVRRECSAEIALVSGAASRMPRLDQATVAHASVHS